jgi:hypothetical protein
VPNNQVEARPRAGERGVTIVLAGIGLTACADTPLEVSHTPATQSDFDAAVVDAGMAPECEDGETKVCACPDGDGMGLRACIGGSFSSCTGCEVVEGEPSKCVPGHYEGRFSMFYTPGPAGICGLTTLFAGGGSGALGFDLIKGEGDEFATVGDGCIHGRNDQVDAGIVQFGAEIFAKGVEFKAGLVGIVDCATGKFEGEMRGTYASTSFCGLGLKTDNFFFKGPITGTFDATAQGFLDGELTMREPPVAIPLAGQPGGTGTWMAISGEHTDAGSLTLPGVDGGAAGDCLGGVTFQDFQLPAGDAGM